MTLTTTPEIVKVCKTHGELTRAQVYVFHNKKRDRDQLLCRECHKADSKRRDNRSAELPDSYVKRLLRGRGVKFITPGLIDATRAMVLLRRAVVDKRREDLVRWVQGENLTKLKVPATTIMRLEDDDYY